MTIKAFSVEEHAERGYTTYVDDYVVPRSFSAYLNDERFPIRLDLIYQDGRPVCAGIQWLSDEDWVSRSDSEAGRPKPNTLRIPLTGAFLRTVPLATIAHEITAAVAREIRKLTARERRSLTPLDETLADRRDPVGVPVTSQGRDGVDRFLASSKSATPRRKPTRGKRTPDHEHAELATIYRAAVRDGRSTSEAVQERFHLAPSSARKRIAQARKRGFLGPAIRGRAGEFDQP
jgi:hypothetical protein